MENLPDDVILEIFDRLTPMQLLTVECANKRFQSLVAIILRKKIKTLIMTSSALDHLKCSHRRDSGRVFPLDKMFDHLLTVKKEASKVIEDDMFIKRSNGFKGAPGRQLFFDFLTKCTGIKSIDFFGQHLNGTTLLQVAKLCPKLHCFAVDCNAFVSIKEQDWSSFADLMHQRLLHCRIDFYLTHSDNVSAVPGPWFFRFNKLQNVYWKYVFVGNSESQWLLIFNAIDSIEKLASLKEVTVEILAYVVPQAWKHRICERFRKMKTRRKELQTSQLLWVPLQLELLIAQL